ncbi:3 beta-hydroxysteroid dehydrogenase type 7-like [Anneissia japonica]|uniref:3 beta-hydroxysteroid dehydrogenase type 7-like n=1 Tax=Anneissia japonica TaxID=1529436 RepID=UPI001425A7F9|nr:3 beta-hydroxysteroid dehydrogenase type 7-like [Anneissia japonica]
MADEGEVVLVTGGCGFVGQHVVKQLLEQEEFPVKEVRTYDLRPVFTWVDELEVKDTAIQLRHISGDITDLNDIRRACEGATIIIHTAGKVDVTACPNVHSLNLVNVTGTENVLKACVDNNISILVFTSTVDVVIGSEPIINGTESTVAIPKSHNFGPYAETKYKSEKIILQANNLILADNKKLKTCALRLPPMYGEGDPNFSVQIKAAKKSGKMMRVSHKSSKLQHLYAGNAGFALVLAANMLRNPKFLTGQAYFITDETPVTSLNEFLSPFLEDLGIKTSSYTLPYWFLYLLAFITELLAWILQPFNLINPVFTTHVVWYINSVFYYNSYSAKKELGYIPVYGYDESIGRSLEYYRRYSSSP